MKIRINFVANSSSSSFIISSSKILDDIRIKVEIPLSELIEEENDCIGTIEELKHYFMNDSVNSFSASKIYFDAEHNLCRSPKLVHEIHPIDKQYVFKMDKVTEEMIQDRFNYEHEEFEKTKQDYQFMRKEIEIGKLIYSIDIDNHANWLDRKKSLLENLKELIEKIEKQDGHVIHYYEG